VETRRPIRVAVVSRHELTRAGLVELVASVPERAVVRAVVGTDAHLGEHDVVVCDVAGQGETGLDLLTCLVESGVPVVALGLSGRPDLVERAVAAGVAATVDLDVSAGKLVALLEQVAAGHRAAWDVPGLDDLVAAAERLGLSTREGEVLVLIARGLSNQDIGRQLFLSIDSIKTYIRFLYRRIGVTSRSQAVLWASDHGLATRRRSDLRLRQD